VKFLDFGIELVEGGAQRPGQVVGVGEQGVPLWPKDAEDVTLRKCLAVVGDDDPAVAIEVRAFTGPAKSMTASADYLERPLASDATVRCQSA
jgi:hypothetical protein